MDDGYTNSEIEDHLTYIKALEHLERAFGWFISGKTKVALKSRKNYGLKLGRPEGSCMKMRRLIRNYVFIKEALSNGESIASLCRKYEVSRSTFYKFMINSGMSEQKSCVKPRVRA